MIEAKNHESTDDSPKISAIKGAIPKKKRHSFADVLSNAAITIAQAFKPLTSKLCFHFCSWLTSPTVGIAPCTMPKVAFPVMCAIQDLCTKFTVPY